LASQVNDFVASSTDLTFFNKGWVKYSEPQGQVMVAKKSGRAAKVDCSKHYTFRRVFTAHPGAGEGCLGVWEVHGGHDRYQIALEAGVGGWRRWHCTCPDAIFRGERLGRACKHVIALTKTLK
jgi:hypothetical protein